jgi:hypothetical protein
MDLDTRAVTQLYTRSAEAYQTDLSLTALYLYDDYIVLSRTASQQVDYLTLDPDGRVLDWSKEPPPELSEPQPGTPAYEVQLLGLPATKEDIFYTYFPDADPMLYFRPPSGAANEWVLNLADKMGYTTVMWSWAHRDFYDDDQPGHAETIEKIKTGLHNGCVYLLHPESTTNTAILGEMIDWIRSQGYEFYPLCDIETE